MVCGGRCASSSEQHHAPPARAPYYRKGRNHWQIFSDLEFSVNRCPPANLRPWRGKPGELPTTVQGHPSSPGLPWACCVRSLREAPADQAEGAPRVAPRPPPATSRDCRRRRPAAGAALLVALAEASTVVRSAMGRERMNSLIFLHCAGVFTRPLLTVYESPLE
jgi:hypothetical protein